MKGLTLFGLAFGLFLGLIGVLLLYSGDPDAGRLLVFGVVLVVSAGVVGMVDG